VSRHYAETIVLRDVEVSCYVANMLTEFCEDEQLHKIRGRQWASPARCGRTAAESDPIYGPAPSFDRERQVRKHIGDYTLFTPVMFPESINRFRLRKNRLENFVDFIKAGRESYYIVSKFDCFEYAKVAPLFRKLAENFEECMVGLNMVKNDLQEMQHPIARRAKEFIM